MGAVHAACLRSFLRHGHTVRLWAYDTPLDTPAGIEVMDASQLLPQSRMIHFSRGGAHHGSPAIFADLLRYELLKSNFGLYVDCDVYCIQPIIDADYIFGYEDNNTINNAVLKIPADSSALADLCSIKDKQAFIPPWFSKKRQLRYRFQALLGSPVPLQKMPWGSTGPEAVTWYLTQSGLAKHAAPIDIYYPVHFGQATVLLEQGLSVRDLITPRTRLLHLYNEKIKHVPVEDVPTDCPLGEILAG